MRFTKMHGTGNDFVLVNAFDERIPEPFDDLARTLCHRSFGIGADGLLIVGPSAIAAAKMRLFNADGSEAEMCGNGIRCVARFLYERGMSQDASFAIESQRGVLRTELLFREQMLDRVQVNMGPPILDPSRIPVLLPGDRCLALPFDIDGVNYSVTCVSMGNPHCVLFQEDLTDDRLLELGATLERRPEFPQRTNVEFVRVVSRQEVEIRVWERGVGETASCGTGACAAVVAAVLNGFTDRAVTCHLAGGDLEIVWTETGDLLLTGAAEETFAGDWPVIA